MNLKIDVLHTIMPTAPYEWLLALSDALPRSDINTAHEVASFIAQIAHESSEFRHLEENMNYSAVRLTQVWPSRFPAIESAQPYEHWPETLGNFVYANRMGNGDPLSGDGYRYRGRGPIQITGRSNYTTCQADTGMPIVNNPDMLLTPEPGIRSSIWFWHANNLDRYDDDNDVRVETRKINGGDTGLAFRQAYFNRALALIGG